MNTKILLSHRHEPSGSKAPPTRSGVGAAARYLSSKVLLEKQQNLNTATTMNEIVVNNYVPGQERDNSDCASDMAKRKRRESDENSPNKVLPISNFKELSVDTKKRRFDSERDKMIKVKLIESCE